MFSRIIDFLAARETVILRLVIVKGSAIDCYDLKLVSAKLEAFVSNETVY